MRAKNHPSLRFLCPLSIYFLVSLATAHSFLQILLLRDSISFGGSLVSMGGAPVDDLQNDSTNGFHLKLEGHEKAINIGRNKTYVIAGTENESTPTIEVRIYDKSTDEWVIPIVLGTKPKSSKGHTAVLLDEDRILVIKGNSTSDDCFWLLEFNTAFVLEQKKRLETEVVAWSRGVIGEAEIPIVISGPSGVGKGTLISKLMGEFPSMFGFSVSHTTRSPRSKEENGVHYHFTERNVMEKDIKDGKFLEFASVHGNLYGTSIEAVEAVTDEGKRCILDIDVQGASSVRGSSLKAIFVFISPPSFEDLEERLRKRRTETEEQIQKRLENARAEIQQGNSPGQFDCILVNDDLETCYKDLKKLLGLDEGAHTPHKLLPELVEVQLEPRHSKNDLKILINCGDAEENSYRNVFLLDISSIKGGAPGRTRGLNVLTVIPPINGTKM